MEINSRQRAYLRGKAMQMDSILQIGKSGIGPEYIQAIDEALEARELIKINVLKNCTDDPKELAIVAAEHTRSILVQVIGRRIVLFRQAKENTRYPLPR